MSTGPTLPKIRARKDITLDFNQIISKFLSNISRRVRSEVDRAGIEQLKSRINLLKSMYSNEVLISRSGEFFKLYGAKISERKISIYMDMDIAAECGKHNIAIDESMQFLVDLFDNMKSVIGRMTPEEHTQLTGDAHKLYCLYLEYFLAEN